MSDANNSPFANADVGAEPWIPAAVDNAGVGDEEVVAGSTGVGAGALIDQ